MQATYISNYLRTDSNPNICRIGSDSGMLAKGILGGPLSINSGAQWGTMGATPGIVSDTASFIARTINSMAGTSLQTGSIQTLSQTVKNWQGSGNPTLAVSLIIPALNAGDNVQRKVMELYKLTLPQDVSSSIITPPLGMVTRGASVIKGSVTVQIGNWFHARQLVTEGVSVEYSQEKTTDGFPLYAVANINLVSATLISGTDIQKWFR